MRRRTSARTNRGGRGAALPAVIAAGLVTTLVTDLALALSDDVRPRAQQATQDRLRVAGVLTTGRPAGAGPAQAATVAPLARRYTPHLLIAAPAALSPAAVERARRVKGVAGLEVVDAANAKVGGRRLGLLGVNPSSFRSYTPRPSAESDQLWLNIAEGGLAVSPAAGQDPKLPLGATVPAGRSSQPGQVRVGAYAAIGMGRVDAVVSREQAGSLGLPHGNGLVVSVRRTDPAKLAKALKKLLPRNAKIVLLTAPRSRRESAPVAPRVSGRPDGVQGDSSAIGGNSMTPRMRDVVVEINNRYGPFPMIGCFRTDADAQDHALGKACDFMESVAGRMPSAGALRHGDQVAQYAISNARRLGIHYVIWKQHIWNISVAGGWRPMADRGSLTQNHWDHVHISVY